MGKELARTAYSKVHATFPSCSPSLFACLSSSSGMSRPDPARSLVRRWVWWAPGTWASLRPGEAVWIA